VPYRVDYGIAAKTPNSMLERGLAAPPGNPNSWPSASFEHQVKHDLLMPMSRTLNAKI